MLLSPGASRFPWWRRGKFSFPRRTIQSPSSLSPPPCPCLLSSGSSTRFARHASASTTNPRPRSSARPSLGLSRAATWSGWPRPARARPRPSACPSCRPSGTTRARCSPACSRRRGLVNVASLSLSVPSPHAPSESFPSLLRRGYIESWPSRSPRRLRPSARSSGFAAP